MLHDLVLPDGKIFSEQDAALLALLVYRRFGCQMLPATHAWQRLMQNTTSIHDFRLLVRMAQQTMEEKRCGDPD